MSGKRTGNTKFFVLVLLSLFGSCASGPEPLNFSTDVCHLCKMTLMDNKFGAELVTEKGKIYKFDDMLCFMNFYNSGYEAADGNQQYWVVDFANPGTLIDATTAFYLSSPEIMSPMNGQVAAFATQDSMEQHKKPLKGIYLTWGEVTTQFK